MDKSITNSQEAFEAACTERGYDPAAVLPDVSKMPVWLGKYLTSTVKRLIIVEALNEGRERKPGEWWYTPYWIFNAKAPFGLSFTNTIIWNTHTYCGSRLEFFEDKNAVWFGKNFMDLHADVLLYGK